MIRPCSIVVGLCLACFAGAALWAGEDARRHREHGQFVAEGTFRGYVLPGVAAAQHQRALDTWKKLYDKETPSHLETDRFLIYGTVDQKRFKEISALLDKTYALAAKTLEADGETPWSGKLAVYLLAERGEYNRLVRALEARRAEEDEQGSFNVDGDFPYVLAGPPLSKADLAPEQQAAEQVAAALLSRQPRVKAPHWVQVAFGRATVLKAGPAKDLTLEHRRVYLAVMKNKRSIKEVLGRSSLDADETTVMRASLLEYLAYSGRTAKFLPFIKGFVPGEDGTEGKIEGALDSANLVADKLDAVWQGWVKTFK